LSRYQHYDVVFKPLRDSTPSLELVSAWRRDDPSSNLQAFLEIVREVAPDENTTVPDVRPALGA